MIEACHNGSKTQMIHMCRPDASHILRSVREQVVRKVGESRRCGMSSTDQRPPMLKTQAPSYCTLTVQVMRNALN